MADFIGTEHYGFTFTVQEGIDAISDVIYHLETYDVTTIRAGTPMFLLARKIKAMGIKMVMSGEGADETLAGYLYFHKAPDGTELHEECVRKVADLHKCALAPFSTAPSTRRPTPRTRAPTHARPAPRRSAPRRYDCLRANKASMAHGLEIRVPFLDKDMLDATARRNTRSNRNALVFSLARLPAHASAGFCRGADEHRGRAQDGAQGRRLAAPREVAAAYAEPMPEPRRPSGNEQRLSEPSAAPHTARCISAQAPPLTRRTRPSCRRRCCGGRRSSSPTASATRGSTGSRRGAPDASPARLGSPPPRAAPPPPRLTPHRPLVALQPRPPSTAHAVPRIPRLARCAQEHADSVITEVDMETAAVRFPHNTPATKEALYFRTIFHEHFPANHCAPRPAGTTAAPPLPTAQLPRPSTPLRP